MRLKRILFPTDFSVCSDQALIEALFLAEQYDAELHVIHVTLPLEQKSPDRSSLLPDLDKVQRHIDDLRKGETSGKQKHYGDVTIVQKALRGISAAQVILEYARERDIDMIVLGTHGRRGFKHLVLGSVADEVVRSSVCPVFSIRETKAGRIPRPIRQILVPVDYSEHSRNALAHAKSIAAEYRAIIRVLHIIEPGAHPSFSLAGPSVLARDPETEAKAASEMKQLVAETPGQHVPVEFHVMEGRAPVDIIGFSKRNDIDLIVMASHGLTGLEHFLLGSVAEKVIRMAPCPVFTVKAFGKRLTTSEPEQLLSSEK